MNRAAFLALPAIFALQYDPATTSQVSELRVLLGSGAATSNADGTFTYQGRRYRGRFDNAPDGSVVNTVSIEEYLYSVVPKEMSPSWPAAALSAQAICARTYVLQRSNPRRNYDLVPSEADQVYLGMGTESAAGRSAVDATSGHVLRYASGYAQIMYSSCCGGHTEASSEAWGGQPLPYLGGVLCPNCTDSPNYRWQRSIALDDVAARFSDRIASYGNLTQLRVSESDGSGRARTVELVCEHGSAFVKGSVFRSGIGPRVVLSLLITKIDASAEAPGTVNIEGGGLGHGVGLCQWGARGMALTGATATSILNFYFPGTTIGND